MIFNYCPSCPGFPYTKNLSLVACPVCGQPLSTEWISSDDELVGRPQLSESSYLQEGLSDQSPWTDDSFSTVSDVNTFGNETSTAYANPFASDRYSSGDHWEWVEPAAADPWNPFQNPNRAESIPSAPTTVAPIESPARFVESNQRSYGFLQPRRVEGDDGRRGNHSSDTIRGRVANYSNSEVEAGSYRRLLIQRIYDALVYGQRFEDLIHRFTVRVGSDDPLSGRSVDVPVNAHGTISGGMQLLDNVEAEVTGRYKNGVLMARRIDVINGGARTTVQFQHDTKGVLIGFFILAIIAFLAFGGLASGGAFIGSLGSFLATWLVMSGIVAAVWLFLFSRMGMIARVLFLRNGRIPLITILALGLLITLATMNAFGLGNAAGSFADSLVALLYELAVPIIMVFGIALMVSSIFK